MIFRTGDRTTIREAEHVASRDELLAAADRTFGRHPERVEGNVMVLDGTVFVYDPAGALAFVLRPDCDRCGTDELDQFPLEEWNVDGIRVRGQARTTCRDCRFLELASAPTAPKVSVAVGPERMRRRTRRYRHPERLAG